MESKNADMHAIFSMLSDINKDIIILIAKSVKVTQEVSQQPHQEKSIMPYCLWGE